MRILAFILAMALVVGTGWFLSSPSAGTQTVYIYTPDTNRSFGAAGLSNGLQAKGYSIDARSRTMSRRIEVRSRTLSRRF